MQMRKLKKHKTARRLAALLDPSPAALLKVITRW